jgi:hypothetical protein
MYLNYKRHLDLIEEYTPQNLDGYMIMRNVIPPSSHSRYWQNEGSIYYPSN